MIVDMDIPLNEFEQHIDETILTRGLSYFRNGRVQPPVETGPGEYDFTVEGSEDYSVQLTIEHGTITEYVCDCPYDQGPVCKHVVAAIFYLQQEELGLKQKSPKKKPSEGKKRRTLAEEVQELLEKTTPEEIKKFVLAYTEQNKDFRNLFLASFAHHQTKESKAQYAKQVKAFIRTASGRYGYLDWSGARNVGMAVEQLLETSRKQMEAGNVQSALYISTAVLEQMTDALEHGDDSNGDLGGCIQEAMEVMFQMAQGIPDEPFRKQLLEYCLTAFEKKLFEGWDWHMDMLQIGAMLIHSDVESKRLLELIDSVTGSEFVWEKAQSLKYEVLLKTQGESVANDYLEQHLTNSKLRRVALQKAIGEKNFDKARTLAQDGIAYDMKEKPGLVVEWYHWLLKIAQEQGDVEHIVAYARHLLIDNYTRGQDHYEILKAQIPPQDWKPFIEKVIEEISTKKRYVDPYQVASLFIKEQWWDRLLDLISKQPSLHTLEHFEPNFPKDYSEKLVGLYSTAVQKYLTENVGRNHYQTACRYLRRMTKLGGREEVSKVVSALREQYPQRKALLDELRTV